MKKRLLTSFIAMTMVFSLLAGCGAGEASDKKGNDEAKTKKSDPDVILVDGEEYQFSADGLEGFKEMDGKAFQCGGMYKRQGRTVTDEYIDLEYYKADGMELTDEAIDEDDVLVLIGTCNGGQARYDRIPGIVDFFYRDFKINVNGDVVRTFALVNNFSEEFQGDTIIAYDHIFINNYSYQGITPDSSLKDVKESGFKRSGYDDMYYTIVSDKATDWDEIDETYEKMYKANITTPQMYTDAPSKYMKYNQEFLGCMFALSSPLAANDKQREIGIGKDADMSREEMYSYYNVEGLNKNTKEVLMGGMAIAEQMYYLERGDIDYFAVVVIEACGPELDNPPGVAHTDAVYDQNVCHVFIFSKEDYAGSYFN